MGKATILLAGPTASGKSALAMAVAEEFGGVVINADSMQVYRELRVITARPTPADEAREAHRLYGVLAAADPCSAGRWRDLALAEITDVWSGGRIPIVVGGSGLYLRALTEGLAPVPAVPAELRMAAAALHRRLGSARFHAALAARDPETARQLEPGDSQRLIRAYEVLEATGKSLAEWQSLPPDGPALPGRRLTLVMAPPRDWLYARCDRRFDDMLAAGAIEEARALAALDLAPSLPVMKALGVPELLGHVRGELDLAAATERAKMQTRRYAKRQTTWFRNQIRYDIAASAQDMESMKQIIFPKICEFLLTARR